MGVGGIVTVLNVGWSRGIPPKEGKIYICCEGMACSRYGTDVDQEGV